MVDPKALLTFDTLYWSDRLPSVLLMELPQHPGEEPKGILPQAH
jgi:hypothetical protein